MLKSGGPLLMKHVLLATFCLILVSTPSAVTAQFSTAFDIDDFKFSREDVERILLDSGASELTVASMMESYPADYDFTEEEVRELLRSIPQEELLEEYKRRKLRPRDELDTWVPPGALRQFPAEREAEAPLEEGEVRPFGYEVFDGSPLDYAPTEDIPVGPEYVLGPGDELYITLWGAVEKNYRVLVNREGNIVLPELGVVHVSGSTIGSFDKKLNRRFSSVYSSFSMDVSLGKLRTIQVFVVGDVVRPGAYMISSVSTVFNALFYAGGPSARGSLRRVLVYRSGEEIASVDLYDYLLRGDSAGDLVLRSGDTVFVTTIGPTASVRGAVKRPAIYELGGGETVADLIEIAGGFTADAFVGRIDIARVDRVSGLISIVTTSSVGGSADSLHGSIGGSPRDSGEDSPRAPHGGGMESSDQDSSATPVEGSLRRPEGDPLQSSFDALLEDGDDVTVYTVWHVHPKRFVSVQGMVQYPGMHALSPAMRVSDLIFKAGGLLDQAYLLRAEVSRIEPEPEASGLLSNLIFIDLEKVILAPYSEENVVLQKGDKVFIRKIPGWRAQHLVYVDGEVRFPGTYTLQTKEERLSYLIERAGGLSPEAFPKAGSVHREDEGRVIVDIAKALEKPGEKDDLLLVDGDSVHIPVYPNTIKVEGAVGRPGSIIFQPGKDADYYVERTGGFLEQADRGSVRIIRLDGSTEKAHKRFWFDPSVEPGNNVIVEMQEKQPDVNWTATIRDATTIVASLATTIYIISRID
jgi:protein involved in polysaccharide export with SLBB domain